MSFPNYEPSGKSLEVIRITLELYIISKNDLFLMLFYKLYFYNHAIILHIIYPYIDFLFGVKSIQNLVRQETNSEARIKKI